MIKSIIRSTWTPAVLFIAILTSVVAQNEETAEGMWMAIGAGAGTVLLLLLAAWLSDD